MLKIVRCTRAAVVNIAQKVQKLGNERIISYFYYNINIKCFALISCRLKVTVLRILMVAITVNLPFGSMSCNFRMTFLENKKESNKFF